MALSTAANMCKKLPSDAADFVMEAVPLLTNLLQYHDSKVWFLFLYFLNLGNALLGLVFLYCVKYVMIVGVGACFCLFDSNC